MVASRHCLLTGCCLNVPSNQQVNPMLAGCIPDHTAFGNTPCVTCHEVDRPPPTIQAVTGIQMIHGDGRDCGECHVAGAIELADLRRFQPLPASCDVYRLSPHGATHRPREPDAPHLSGRRGLRRLSRGRRGGHLDQRNVRPRTHSRQLCRMSLGTASDHCGERFLARRRRHGRLRELSPQRGSDVERRVLLALADSGEMSRLPCGRSADWAWSALRRSITPPHNGAGLGDCKSCHIVFSATQTDWSGGSFSHIPDTHQLHRLSPGHAPLAWWERRRSITPMAARAIASAATP